MKKLACVAVFLLVAGAVFGWQGWQQRGLWERIETAGKDVPGVLREGSVQHGRKGKKTFLFTVAYTPEGGAARQQDFEVSREFAERVTKDDTIVAPDCTVRYDPTDPMVAIVVGGSPDGRPKFTLGLCLAGAGFVLGIVALRRKQPEAAPLAAG
ncbi:MAG: hypothetical protein JNK15_19360 [Planctomycetes bacterium]|nr:hypothetical protein [Planctomycetota bacterium]